MDILEKGQRCFELQYQINTHTHTHTYTQTHAHTRTQLTSLKLTRILPNKTKKHTNHNAQSNSFDKLKQQTSLFCVKSWNVRLHYTEIPIVQRCFAKNSNAYTHTPSRNRCLCMRIIKRQKKSHHDLKQSESNAFHALAFNHWCACTTPWKLTVFSSTSSSRAVAMALQCATTSCTLATLRSNDMSMIDSLQLETMSPTPDGSGDCQGREGVSKRGVQ